MTPFSCKCKSDFLPDLCELLWLENSHLSQCSKIPEISGCHSNPHTEGLLRWLQRQSGNWVYRHLDPQQRQEKYSCDNKTSKKPRREPPCSSRIRSACTPLISDSAHQSSIAKSRERMRTSERAEIRMWSNCGRSSKVTAVNSRTCSRAPMRLKVQSTKCRHSISPYEMNIPNYVGHFLVLMGIMET